LLLIVKSKNGKICLLFFSFILIFHRYSRRQGVAYWR
jgi:hypothetical protein